MKKLSISALCVCYLFVFSSVASAGWSSCVACHNGTMAPNKEKLLEKYKSAESFIAAAKQTQNPLMKTIKKDEAALKAAAQDIGLK